MQANKAEHKCQPAAGHALNTLESPKHHAHPHAGDGQLLPDQRARELLDYRCSLMPQMLQVCPLSLSTHSCHGAVYFSR